MQSPRNNPRKGIKFFDTKVLIATMSVAVTIGMWNMLSRDLIRSDQAAAVPTVVTTLPPQPPTGIAQDLPPLPTLVPLAQAPARPAANGAAANTSTGAADTKGQPAGQTLQLRAVAVPTVEIVQKNNILVDQPVSIVGGGGGGGGSHSSATTRSSH